MSKESLLLLSLLQWRLGEYPFFFGDCASVREKPTGKRKGHGFSNHLLARCRAMAEKYLGGW